MISVRIVARGASAIQQSKNRPMIHTSFASFRFLKKMRCARPCDAKAEWGL